LIVDTRNAFRKNGIKSENIYFAWVKFFK
jgi:hypothetical protein